MNLEPTYGTSIKFESDGLVTPMAHRYFSSAINGVNSLSTSLNLKFEGDKDDIDTVYEDFRLSDGVSLLTYECAIPRFYRPFEFHGYSCSTVGARGSVETASLFGKATLEASVLSLSGQSIDLYDELTGEFNTDRVKVINDDSEFEGLELEAYQVVYYDAAPIKSFAFRSNHALWNKIFFVGDDYLKFCEDNSLDFRTYIDSEAKFLELLTQSLPKMFDSALEIPTTSTAGQINFPSSFKTRIKTEYNQTGFSGLSLKWDNLTDTEAFALTAFCEARLVNRSSRISLPSPYDRVGEYIVLSWEHAFVDSNVNSFAIEMQPKFNSYTKC